MSDKIYSQGVMHDGPVILCAGKPMTPEAIVSALNNYRVELKANIDGSNHYRDLWHTAYHERDKLAAQLDVERELKADANRQLNEMRRERDALAEELKALREQKPVAYVGLDGEGVTEAVIAAGVDLDPGTVLYASPVPASQDEARDALAFAIRFTGGIPVVDWSAKGGYGCRTATDEEAAMWAILAAKKDGV